jgi:hypothetical protein
MARRFASLPLLLAPLILLTCSAPKDPWEDPKNSQVTLLTPVAPPQGLYIGDTVTIGAQLRLADFFDSVRISLDSYWDTTIAISSAQSDDTLWVSHVLEQAGATLVLVTGYVRTGLTREQSGSINVLGLVPSFVRNLSVLTTVTAGRSLTLSISAAGTPPMHYQWLHNDSALAAETLSILSRPNAQFGDSGTYACIISNPWGLDTSNPGAVLVYPVGTPDAPGGLAIAGRSGGLVTLRWHTVAGAGGYRIYRDTLALAVVH